MSRTVTEARLAVGQPFIYNSRFEVRPSGSVATNTGSRWIDGTATGSLTDRSIGWGIPSLTPSCEVSVDTTTTHNGYASLKINALDTAGNAAATIYRSTANGFALPVQPSTSYRLQCWAKSTNAPTNSANIAFRTLSSTYTTLSTNTSNTLSGTQDWTLLQVTFTTESNAAFFVPLLRTVAGAISTVWFTEIDLLPQSVINTRTAAV